jgi:hypothetical protein
MTDENREAIQAEMTMTMTVLELKQLLEAAGATPDTINQALRLAWHEHANDR